MEGSNSPKGSHITLGKIKVAALIKMTKLLMSWLTCLKGRELTLRQWNYRNGKDAWEVKFYNYTSRLVITCNNSE